MGVPAPNCLNKHHLRISHATLITVCLVRTNHARPSLSSTSSHLATPTRNVTCLPSLLQSTGSITHYCRSTPGVVYRQNLFNLEKRDSPFTQSTSIRCSLNLGLQTDCPRSGGTFHSYLVQRLNQQLRIKSTLYGDSGGAVL